jgi:parallel beta-helix repeat protein
MRLLDAALGAALGAMTLQAQPATPRAAVPLRRGMVITKSTTIAKQRYRLAAAASLDSALIVIRGDDITLDLNDATIEGTDPAADPDRAAGVAIRVDGGRNVTIQRGTIRGYRVAILARRTKNLTIQSNDLSHNWKPRLYSLVEHESLADWLSFHHNEKGEWLRFGAAIYLDGVTGGEIRINRAEQGMNGLMMVRSDSVRVVDNSFRFNSGLGIGLYRSSGNSILANRLDFNVRGFSNGFYRRGQDSADLLLYEQSSHNIVAWNSATHGGDGLFLWAGQSTMDSGEGGANDNLFFGNDFSFAPTNAMEATFSRNTFAGNRAEGSDYGLWGGYSYESRVVGNCFARNRTGIAIEHGQDNEFSSNRFDGDGTAIRLWGDQVEPGDWGYPKHRDTNSRNARITANRFSRNRVGVNAVNTRELTLAGNTFEGVDTTMVLKDTAGVRSEDNVGGPARPTLEADPCVAMGPLPAEYARLAPAAEGIAPEVPRSALSVRDRSAIIVDEWGPYDWRSPKLWPVDSTHSVPLRLAVLGPAGRWRVVGRRGVAAVSATTGRMNDTITVTPRADSLRDWQMTLEYTGALAVSSRGVIVSSGTPLRFSFGTFEPAQAWEVKFFIWSDSTDPRGKQSAFAALWRGAPVATARAPRLDFMWYRPTIALLPQSKWALEARSTVTLAPGTYTLRTISDDAVRVWVDGKLVIDDWKPHESAVDVAPISAGKHELRVQYFQVDGWTELRLDIVRGSERAAGSPGPH